MRNVKGRLFPCLLVGLFVLSSAFMAVLLSAPPARAAGNDWQDTLGPRDASTQSLLFVSERAELYGGMGEGGVWYYNEKTDTWSDKIDGGTKSIRSLAWDNDHTLYAGVYEGGVEQYDSITGTWSQVGSSIGELNVRALAWNGPSLFAGTDHRGVWSYGPDTWYLAEGCTDGGMETFVLVQNPNAAEVKVSFTLMTEDGAQQPAGLQNVAIPAKSRSSFNLGTYVTTYNVSTRVEVVEGTASIVCERAMYGNDRAWAHDSIGYPR